MKKTTDEIQEIIMRVGMQCLGNKSFWIRVSRDFHDVFGGGKTPGRIFIQVQYTAPCVKTGEPQIFRGRKWYLSDYMTEDEIIKTAYCAFEAAVKHEIMEGFSVDGTILFNPHVDYKALLTISNHEVKREEIPGGT